MALTHDFQHVAVLLKLQCDRLVPHWRQRLLLHAGGEELLVGQPHLTERVTVAWVTTTVTVADQGFDLTGDGVGVGEYHSFLKDVLSMLLLKLCLK